MIYALLDKEALTRQGLSLAFMAQKIESLSIPIVQYRNKSGTVEEQHNDLNLIKSIYSGRLIINDHIDLIDMADGLHIGQEDIQNFHSNKSTAIQYIRTKIGKKTLGLSTHNYVEIIEANNLDVDYIGLGAYRGTTTKENVIILGDQALELAKYSHHPVALIGGVKRTDAFDSSIHYRVIGSDLYEN